MMNVIASMYLNGLLVDILAASMIISIMFVIAFLDTGVLYAGEYATCI